MLLCLAGFAGSCDGGLVLRDVGVFQLFLCLLAVKRFAEGLLVLFHALLQPVES